MIVWSNAHELSSPTADGAPSGRTWAGVADVRGRA